MVLKYSSWNKIICTAENQIAFAISKKKTFHDTFQGPKYNLIDLLKFV